MAISLVAVGGKITAALVNLLIGGVNAQGQTGVIPTSVAGTGVSVGAAGKVTAASSTTISVNGCFTATYTNYTIKFDLTTSGASNLAFVLRLSGTDAVTGYDSQRLTSGSTTTASAQSLNGASLPLTTSGLASRQAGSVDFYGPALAASTVASLASLQTPNPMTTSAVLYTALFQHRDSTAYDGFTITTTTGTVSGTIRIYGWNNN